MNNPHKILLVHPEISRTKYNYSGVIENEPLELEVIVPVLRQQGFEVAVFDKAVEQQSVKSFIQEYNPTVFYVCGRTRQQNYMLEYCAAAKANNPNTITIAGGIDPQNNPTMYYKKDVDYVLTTFDIFKIPEIIRLHETQNTGALKAMSGICFRQGKEWTQNPPEPFDINRLPWADREYFSRFPQNYRYLELLPCAHVRTSYSCPNNCTFCYRRQLNCGQYTQRSMEDIVAEIKSISCENIFIIDDTFLISPARIQTFINLIKQNNIHKKYVCYGRADFIVQNPELITQLKEIGFYYILVGLESPHNATLATYNKGTSENMNLACIEILNKAGIHIMALLIADLSFTPKDFRNMRRWVIAHNIRHVAISIFTPELGSPLYEEYKGRILSDNPEHWDYLHVVAKPSRMSTWRFYACYYWLITRLMLRAKRQGVYDFIDYKLYISSFLKNLFTRKVN